MTRESPFYASATGQDEVSFAEAGLLGAEEPIVTFRLSGLVKYLSYHPNSLYKSL